MLGNHIETLKEIINIDEQIEKRLTELDQISSTIRYLERFIDCDYNDPCYTTYGTHVKRLRDWLHLYKVISENEPENILNNIPLSFKITIDYSDLVLKEIRHKDTLIDSIYPDIKLPLDEKGKEKLLNAIKDKIRKMVEEIPEEYVRAIITVLVILRSIADRLDTLWHNYSNLQREIDSIARRIAMGEVDDQCL